MGRTTVVGFVGPSNEQVSKTLDCEWTRNLILQPVVPGTGRAQDALVNRPGLTPFANAVGATAIRAAFAQNGRAWVIASSTFQEVFLDGSLGPGFTVADDGLPASMCSNGSAGNQIFITSGGLGYIYDTTTDTLTQITDPNFLLPAGRGEFFEGYFVNYKGDFSRSFQISALEDGLTWSGLDIFERQIASDSILTIIRSHRELWILGLQTSEVWYNSGNASTAIQPIQGVFIEHGAQAPYAVSRADNTLFWLGVDTEGYGVVWRADGYTPKRISTHALERVLQGVDLTAAVSWVCQLEGHYYYVLIVPTLETSWVYDLSRDRWIEWAHWDSTNLEWLPFRGWNHMLFGFSHLVGDRLTGTIYRFTPSVYTDELTDVA